MNAVVARTVKWCMRKTDDDRVRSTAQQLVGGLTFSSLRFVNMQNLIFLSIHVVAKVFILIYTIQNLDET